MKNRLPKFDNPLGPTAYASTTLAATAFAAIFAPALAQAGAPGTLLSVQTSHPILAQAQAQSPLTDLVVEPQRAAAPQKLPAENVDGSRVDARTQRAAAEIIRRHNDLVEAGDPEANPKTLAALLELHRQDDKNLSVITWIGYLYTLTGDQANAIPFLEKAKGASRSPEVNLQNLRNLAGAYYLSADYAKAAATLQELDQTEPGKGDTLALWGSSLVLSKRYEEAIPVLRRARAALGDDPDSLRSVSVDLGLSFARTNQPQEAMGVFDDMRSDPALTADQLAWMGFIYLQNKRHNDAIQTFEAALAKDAGNLAVLNNLGTAYLQRNQEGDRDKAKQTFARLADLAQNNPVAAYNVGSMYLADGDFARAKPFLQRAAQGSNDPFAFNNLGRAHEGLGENQEAAANYARASDAQTSNATFARNAGFAYLRLGRQADAVKYLSRANQAGDTSPELTLALANTLNRTGQRDQALRLFTSPEMQAAMQNDADYWFNLGVLYNDLNRHTDAEDAYRRSLAIRPDDADAVNNLGVLLFQKEDYEGALAQFQRQRDLAPNNSAAQLNVAACLVRLDRLPEAIEIWRNIVRADPTRADVRLDLADALWNTGDTPGARFHYATIVRENPNSARGLNGLGMWALLQTETAQAESLFRRAVNADRRFVPAYINLAVSLERLNRVSDAVKTLEAALAVEPGNELVASELQRLRNR